MTELPPSPPAARERRAFRPPVGMPGGRSRSRLGSIVSLLIHLVILWLLVREADYNGVVIPMAQGAGGPGPAGGGGGRSSAKMEVIQYVQVQPAPPAPPKPVLVFKTPEIRQLPQPAMEPLKLEPIVAPGLNATGTAIDPNGGAGPGTGGGVGTGDGTGNGAAKGPGTGGGLQENYPPEPDQMFLPPFPVPSNLKGRSILAELDVDDRGRVLGVKFSATGERAYDRRLVEVLKDYHFKPGHKPDGTPIRMKYQLKIEL
ncbi:MAG TPA: hypothetical protein VF483_02595 [Gemmatimonadaceae bacterium]